MRSSGAFPVSWFFNTPNGTEIQRWFPLPSNLINKGEEWIPEIKQNATVYLLISIKIE
jgi:hypothetical protein